MIFGQVAGGYGPVTEDPEWFRPLMLPAQIMDDLGLGENWSHDNSRSLGRDSGRHEHFAQRQKKEK
jgi:hypothetical protein